MFSLPHPIQICRCSFVTFVTLVTFVLVLFSAPRATDASKRSQSTPERPSFAFLRDLRVEAVLPHTRHRNLGGAASDGNTARRMQVPAETGQPDPHAWRDQCALTPQQPSPSSRSHRAESSPNASWPSRRIRQRYPSNRCS